MLATIRQKTRSPLILCRLRFDAKASFTKRFYRNNSCAQLGMLANQRVYNGPTPVAGYALRQLCCVASVFLLGKRGTLYQCHKDASVVRRGLGASLASTPTAGPASPTGHQRAVYSASALSDGSLVGNGAALTELEGGLGTLKKRVSEIEARLAQAVQVQDLSATRARLAALENDAGASDMWSDTSRAASVMAQAAALREQLQEVDQQQLRLDESKFALELLEASDTSAEEQSGIVREALTTLNALEADLEAWEVRRLLGGPYDDHPALLTISAGAGGVDAMDWAGMLERMYTRWAEQHGRPWRVLDRAPGEEAGVKSVELEIGGPSAYGWLRGEKGAHRLVRSSPFNAKGLRQTSFAGVEVVPVLGNAQVSLDIPERDLEVSFMRSGGAGGQNVNKVSTGVRLVHVPTGLAVKCTQERTQIRNRSIALEMLKAKLLVVLQEQQAVHVADIRGELVRAEWGQQVRNYVLHPYKLVKDTRTGMETSDVESVLDGGLDELMTAYLREGGRKRSQAELGAAMCHEAN